MNNFYSEELKHMLWLFGNDFRLQIVNVLSQNTQGKSGVALSKAIGTREAAVLQRPIEQLVQQGILCRNNRGFWILSGYGLRLSKQLEPMKFVADNKEFFKVHSYGDMPDKFTIRLGDLNQSRHITNEVTIHEIWTDMYSNSEEYIYNILPTPDYRTDFLEPLHNLWRKGGHSKTIFTKNFDGGKKQQETRKKYKISKFELSGQIERKMQDKILISVVVTEKEAFIMFPDEKGRIDNHEMFYGDNSTVHDFCLDYFNHCWNNAEEYGVIK